jgi:hypothetical protein
MGNLFSRHDNIQITIDFKPKILKKKSTYSKLFTVCKDIGFRHSLLIKNKKVINDALFANNYSNVDAIKTLWRHWMPQQDHSNAKELLQSVGFKQGVINTLLPVVEPIWNEYAPSLIVDIAIEFLFDKFAEYAPNIKHGFLFDAPHVVVLKNIHKSVGHLNFAQDLEANERLVYSHFKKPDNELYFHATNWTGAISICKEGVVHDAGRSCLDFGMKPGFYIAPAFGDSLEWAFRKSKLFKNERAILVFSISKVFPSDLNVKRFEKPNREWTRLTKESRACFLKYNELDTFDFVFGPMVADTYKGIPHNPVKYQLASKSIKSDDFLNNALVGILWLKK